MLSVMDLQKSFQTWAESAPAAWTWSSRQELGDPTAPSLCSVRTSHLPVPSPVLCEQEACSASCSPHVDPFSTIHPARYMGGN